MYQALINQPLTTLPAGFATDLPTTMPSDTPTTTLPAPGFATNLPPNLTAEAPVMTLLEPENAAGKAKANRDPKIVYWKTCQFCHHSFEYLEKHLAAKKSECGKDPQGQPWSAAQIKGLVNISKQTMETNQKSKQYYSAFRLKAAIREAGTLHKLCISLFELTGVFFDTTEVEDCKVLLQDKPATTSGNIPAPCSSTFDEEAFSRPTLKGEEDGANYFLQAGELTIDARLPNCECHPE